MPQALQEIAYNRCHVHLSGRSYPWFRQQICGCFPQAVDEHFEWWAFAMHDRKWIRWLVCLKEDVIVPSS